MVIAAEAVKEDLPLLKVRRRCRRWRPNPILICGGAIAFLAIAIQVAPLVVVVMASVTPKKYLTFPPGGFSLGWYARIGDNPGFVTGLKTSLALAALTVGAVLMIGTPAAASIVRRGGKVCAFLENLFLSPLLFPTVVFGLAYLALISQTALIPRFYGALVVDVILVTPYYIRSVAAGLREMDPAVVEASQSLGAKAHITLTRVAVPAVRNSIIAGCVFSFIIAFDEPVVSLFLTSVSFMPLPAAIYGYLQYSNDPTIAALSSLLIGGGLVAMVLLNRLTGGKATNI